jgi:ubiquinone/menaquinone biosynthesis C-methylase UbiE
MTELYTPGHGATALSLMARRRAASHAAFFTPALRPGMVLLDCGCGPGTITLDLARLVAPGPVTGLDAAGGQLAAAEAAAETAGLDVAFVTGSVYALPFPDASFDAVFSHALFEHLARPADALAELKRVLRPGGVIGLRSPDWGGFLIHPLPPLVREAIRFYQALQSGNGGDAEAGRKLAAWLRAAGFAEIRPSAGYEIYESAPMIAEYLAERLDRVEGEDDVPRRLAAALRDWGWHRDALFAQAWGEALAIRP